MPDRHVADLSCLGTAAGCSRQRHRVDRGGFGLPGCPRSLGSGLRPGERVLDKFGCSLGTSAEPARIMSVDEAWRTTQLMSGPKAPPPSGTTPRRRSRMGGRLSCSSARRPMPDAGLSRGGSSICRRAADHGSCQPTSCSRGSWRCSPARIPLVRIDDGTERRGSSVDGRGMTPRGSVDSSVSATACGARWLRRPVGWRAAPACAPPGHAPPLELSRSTPPIHGSRRAADASWSGPLGGSTLL
jgi:hypothetical protein